MDTSRAGKQKEFDRSLLIEVVAANPYHLGNLKKGSGWKEVAENVSRNVGQLVTERRARDRTEDLLKSFKKTDAIQRSKSGIEEKFTEEDKLLLDLLQLKETATADKQSCRDEEKNTEQKAKEIRLRAMFGMAPKRANDQDSSKTAAKKLRSEMLRVLKEKEDKQEDFRTAHMTLMKEDLAFKKRQEEARSKSNEEERHTKLEELRIKERMAEEDRALRREELRSRARREEEERKLRLEEMKMRDAREREASERQTDMMTNLMRMLVEKK